MIGISSGEEHQISSHQEVGHDGSSTSGLVGGRKNKRRRDRVRLQEGSRIREPGSIEPEAVPFTGIAPTPSSGDSENQKPNSVTMLGLSSALNLVTKISDKMSHKKQGK